MFYFLILLFDCIYCVLLNAPQVDCALKKNGKWKINLLCCTFITIFFYVLRFLVRFLNHIIFRQETSTNRLFIKDISQDLFH